MITIEKLNESHLEAVKRVTLSDPQIAFAGTAEDFIAQRSDTTHLHVISHQKMVVGFFKLDLAYASKYEFCPEQALGLRAFAIDQKQQGKGLGTLSVQALLRYLAKHYSAYKHIFLSVNVKNPTARACYLKGGFEDTGELYLKGPVGPQHIMRAPISPLSI
ncbi:GNAT family N-acetyltransferase [Vibrio ostreicida]|uniref:GNAT family N-acetyltransferase n=1 Tax=Vibrio ostreicida TaxID=526588 RepID=A0ABT8BXN7_9VIBR|nr:GNAT family N-acetyltransferase [Vibrio ostreicida]MDN3611149.1 GNAT family N-acetyltransferase [Vibrio ostreicida]MDN3612268.1 GNAT family N-acetyltransferase [Vibrio ostreicida]NPD08652.1 GNAT family N-acetyltransferase [Vibrio ostreicida]